VHAELRVDVLEVLAHGARRSDEDLGDLSIRLALGHPFEHLLLAWSEPFDVHSFDRLLANEESLADSVDDDSMCASHAHE
jgi:hypothetical protein